MGDDCPVCAQRVPVLPAPLPAADLAEAELAVTAAGQAHEAARDRAAATELATARAGEILAGLDESAEQLWSGAVRAVAVVLAGWSNGGRPASFERLAAGLVAAGVPKATSPVPVSSVRPDGAPPSDAGPGIEMRPDPAAVAVLAAALDDVLAGLDRLAEQATATDAAVRTARRDRAVAAGTATTVHDELAAATAQLRAARDPLVSFGAPDVAGDAVLAGWTTLLAWVRAEAATRDRAVPASRAAVAAAENAVELAERQWRTAERAARDRRTDETSAARAEQEARDAVANLDRRAEQLRVELVDAPTDEEAAAELARRDELESAAAAAETELRAARAEARSAERASAEVAREVSAGWQALRAARDPLVPLNAPALRDDDLRAAWTALIGWAGDRAAAGEEQLAAAGSAVLAAEREAAAVADRIAADLAAHAVPVTGPLAESALPAVVGVAERARAGQQRLAERRAEATRIAGQRDAAEAAQQVAKLLGALLRSDGFPRWLVASALDALVADASASLLELSGGQFELTHAGGEFYVVDHADADARRPVKTLSGGETFQASLSLALALSAQLSGLAAEGAPQLESIFLDEGFGTLDEANLEIVASTLENLAARGDRVVGVITHVPALAERVPVRFAVRRDERTSSVVREDL